MFCVDVTSFVLLLDLLIGEGLTVLEPNDAGDVAISVEYFDELSASDDIFRRLYGRRPSEKCKQCMMVNNFTNINIKRIIASHMIVAKTAKIIDARTQAH